MSVARAYAKALFEAARDLGADSPLRVEEELSSVTTAVESSQDASRFLFSPVSTAKEKVGVLDALAQKAGASQLTIEFLRLLANKGRLSLLSEVTRTYTHVRLVSEGRVPGTVVSAEALDPSDVESLASAFSRKLGKKVAFTVSTDPNLLAGMKVTVGGVTYDGSLRSQLQQLRDRVLSGYTERAELKN